MKSLMRAFITLWRLFIMETKQRESDSARTRRTRHNGENLRSKERVFTIFKHPVFCSGKGLDKASTPCSCGAISFIFIFLPRIIGRQVSKQIGRTSCRERV